MERGPFLRLVAQKRYPSNCVISCVFVSLVRPFFFGQTQLSVPVFFQILSFCVYALGSSAMPCSAMDSIFLSVGSQDLTCCSRIFQTSSSWSVPCSQMTSAASLTFFGQLNPDPFVHCILTLSFFPLVSLHSFSSCRAFRAFHKTQGTFETTESLTPKRHKVSTLRQILKEKGFLQACSPATTNS